MTDVPIRYVGQDNTGAASASAKRNIESVGKAAGTAGGGVKGFSKLLAEMGPAGRTASQALESMGGGLTEVGGLANMAGTALKGLVAGAVIGGVAQLGRALANLGVQAMAGQEMRAALEGVAQTAGLAADDVLASMRRASEGMVSNNEMVALSNRAIMMKAADSAQEMAALMEVAKVRSDAVGISVGQAFGALSEGIGRVSERQLYGLGIQLDMDAAMKTYAGSIGKTADKLSEAERRQALYNAVIADSESLVKAAGAAGLSNADKMDQFAASWADLKQTLGELVAGPMADFVEWVNKAATAVNDAMTPEPYQKTGQAIDDLTQKMMDMTAASSVVDNDQVRVAQELADAYGQQAAILREQLGAANVEVRMAQDDMNAAMQRGDADMKAYNDELARAQGEVSRIRGEIDAAVYSQKNWQNAISQANAELAQQNAQLMVGSYGWAAQKAATEQAAAVAAEAAARQTSAENLAEQYAKVAPIQEAYRAVAEAQMAVKVAAEEAGLSVAQTTGILANMAAQYDVLTQYGYTGAQAIGMVRDNAMSSIGPLAEATASAAALAEVLGIVIPAASSAATDSVVAFANIAAQALSSVMTALGDFTGAIGSHTPTPARDGRAAKRGRTSPTMINGSLAGVSGVGVGSMPAPMDWMNDSQYKSALAAWDKAGQAARSAGGSLSGLGGSADGLKGKFDDLSGGLQGMIDKVPGLKSPSAVTEDQMNLAKMGVPQNFADNYLRRLTDEVMNGVDWEGVDIKDAAARAGIDQNLPAQAILEMFRQAWANNSLFANAQNLDLIDMDAVKASLQQQMAAQQGKANLMALFGIGEDSTVQAVAGLGLSVQTGLAAWLSENGMGDAGARLAEALGGGLAGSGETLGGGLATGLNAGADTQAVSDAISGISGRLSQKFNVVITPTLADPVIPPGYGSGGATAPPPPSGATVPPSGGPVRAASYYNGANSRAGGAQVAVTAVINNGMDRAQFERWLKDAMRKATVRA